MKTKINGLKKYLEVNKKLFVFLTGILLFSIFAGSVFSLTLNDSDTSLVSEFLSNYLEDITTHTLSTKEIIKNVLLENVFLASSIAILSYSVVGIPVIILLFFYKSFIIGFSISSILLNYRIKGVLLSILYVFPHQVVSLLLLITLIVNGILISFSIINMIFTKKEEKPKNKQFFKVFLIITSLLIIMSLYETIILPFILKLILTIK